MKFKLKDAGRRTYGAGPTEYCLAKEAEEIVTEHRLLADVQTTGLGKLWKLERHLVRRQFFC